MHILVFHQYIRLFILEYFIAGISVYKLSLSVLFLTNERQRAEPFESKFCVGPNCIDFFRITGFKLLSLYKLCFL